MAETKYIIHLSDLHIRNKGDELSSASRVFEYVAREYPGSPVLITGDVVDSGSSHQMDLARVLLDNLAKTNPILVVPGNHDYAWKGISWLNEAWDDWVKKLGAPLGWAGLPAGTTWLTGVCSSGVDGLGVWKASKDSEFVFFGVDSGDPKNKVHTSRGYISAGLATALENELINHQGKCRVVLLHHHPFDDGAFMKLVGADLLMNAVRGNCELLLFGHDHRLGIWRNRDQIPLIVASHKTTDKVLGQHLMINIIEIHRAEAGNWMLHHRLETA